MLEIDKLLDELEELEVEPVGLRPGKKRIEDLTESGYVGLSVVRDKNFKPLKVCLTTEKKIHVLEPSLGRHQIFLREQLGRKDITFFTVDGVNDADTLAEYMQIIIRDQMDLTAMDICLRGRQALLNGVQPSEDINYRTNIEHLPNLRCLSYKDMVKRYLNLEINTDCSKEELASLTSLRLDDSAIKCVLKTAKYVRLLAKVIEYETRKLRDEPSKNIIYDFAIVASDADRNNFDSEESNLYHDLRGRLTQIRLMQDDL